MKTRKNIIILGSTGSVGTQTLDVIRANPDKFNVIGLSCNTNIELLLKQIKEFKPGVVCISQLLSEKSLSSTRSDSLSTKRDSLSTKRDLLSSQLCSLSSLRKQGSIIPLSELAQYKKADLVVNALSGKAGVDPTIKAVEAGKDIALANKEVWAYTGPKLCKLIKKYKVQIIPLDSEHSAIFQCLQGEDPKNIEKIVLTCSGGPFYGKSTKDLINISVKDCLNHPTWPDMGRKILIDCATLANKGLEIIEAKYMFNLKPRQIEVVIHRESLVHGFVCFKDGGIKAVISPNDMRIPIAYALNFPDRDFSKISRHYLCQNQSCCGKQTLSRENRDLPFNNLTFQKPDFKTFEALKLAYLAAQKGPKYEKKYVESNDKAVEKFLKGEIGFLDIQKFIKSNLKNPTRVGN